MAVGIGFDIHRLAPGRQFILGGVKMDHPKGPVGHSDGDVVFHALVDALLGATGGGDIGERFPDRDPQWQDAASVEFVRAVWRDLRKRWKVVNVDAVVFAEEPHLGRVKRAIGRAIADLLEVKPEAVNVKAKTMEKLGPIGAGEAIAAQVVVELAAHKK
jgi:2-C-methyl-D-erythritol 2,4-cyclodiphosphate synthase